MGAERCEVCRFFIGLGEEGEGMCRRFPPTENVMVGDRVRAVFPMPMRIDWCGEFEKKTSSGRGKFEVGGLILNSAKAQGVKNGCKKFTDEK